MTGHERRIRILLLLQETPAPITGTELASALGVSRQVIVQDVALLRAGGADVLATPQGYTLATAEKATVHRAVLAVRHDRAGTAEELTVLVDRGVRVVDVIVEHPFYGEQRGMLMIETRDDVAEFLRRLEETHAPLLSSLTGGVHLHTVEALRPEAIQRAREELQRRGILLGDADDGGSESAAGAPPEGHGQVAGH